MLWGEVVATIRAEHRINEYPPGSLWDIHTLSPQYGNGTEAGRTDVFTSMGMRPSEYSGKSSYPGSGMGREFEKLQDYLGEIEKLLASHYWHKNIWPPSLG